MMDGQRRRSNPSGTPTRTKMVDSPPYPLKLFCRSLFIVFTFFCILFWLLFVFELPIDSEDYSTVRLNPKRLEKHFNPRSPSVVKSRAGWGFFGEMMVGMLPQDLPFTVFVPVEQDLRRILGLKENSDRRGNFTDEMAENSTVDNTVAVVSRILGYSAVPLHLLARSVPVNGEVVVDSLSGFSLQVAKSSKGVLYVNNISCEVTDLRRGEIVVHVVRGVIMDADFEQSTRPDEDEETRGQVGCHDKHRIQEEPSRQRQSKGSRQTLRSMICKIVKSSPLLLAAPDMKSSNSKGGSDISWLKSNVLKIRSSK